MSHPHKKVFDTVFKFIYFDQFAADITDTVPFQRLRHIKQLGAVDYVFPGATHSRMAHSMGVMYLTLELFDQVVKRTKLTVPSQGGVCELSYLKVVLAIAALLHDIGHAPFSHTAEKAVLGDKGHEIWAYRILESSYYTDFFEQTAHQLGVGVDKFKRDVYQSALSPQVLSELGIAPSASEFEKLIFSLISNDLVGSDRCDYLLRDATYTNLVYGHFDYQQLIESLQIVDVSGSYQLVLEEDGLIALESLLLARKMMYQRLYLYSKVKEYTYHYRQLIANFYRENAFLDSVESYLGVNDAHVTVELQRALKMKEHPCHTDAKAIYGLIPRKKSYRISRMISPSDIEAFMRKYGIEESEISVDYIDFTDKDLSCHVLEKSGRIYEKDYTETFTALSDVGSWIVCDENIKELFYAYFGEQ